MRRLLIALLLSVQSVAAWANCSLVSGNAERTPDSGFAHVNQVPSGTEEVTHNTTGLIWMQCAWGLSGNDTCTTGTVGTYTWQQALQLATGNWRLPSRNELLSIVETGCSSNMINTHMFPNSPPSGTFWTSTPLDEGYSSAAWAVRFGDGTLEAKEKSSLNYVRLVRSGTADETFNSASAPPAGGPDAFSFTANTTALPGTQATSNVVTLSGITGSVPISISGGEYLIIRPVTFTNATETVNRTGHGNVFGGAVAFGSTGTLPAGISAGTNYYVTGKNSIGSTITFTDAGEIVNWTAHGLTNNTKVVFTNSGGALPTGITAGTTYYVTGKNSTGSTISFNTTGSVVTWTAHGLPTCTAIVFNTGTAPSGITLGTTYWVRTVPDANTFTLTSTTPTGSDCTAYAQRTFTTAGSGTQVAWTDYVLPNSFSITSSAAAVQALAFTGAGSGTHTVWTDKVLADSFSIASTANAVQGLTFSDDGTGTHYLIQSGLGSWSASAGTVSNSDQLQVRLTAAGTGSTTRAAAVNINGRTADFSVTTAGPSPIAFTPRTAQDTNFVVTSDAPTLSGITGSVNITALSGTGTNLAVLKNGTPYTAANLPLAVSNGDTIALRQTTSASLSTTTTAIVTINGQNFTFTATTAAGAVEPEDFSFTPQSEVRRSATITSDTVQVVGLTTARDVTVSGTGAAYIIGRPVSFSNANDLINWTGHGLQVGSAIRFVNIGGSLPAGLTTGTTYYVISAGLTGDAFKVSTTPGGGAVDFTSDGTGNHFAQVYGVPVTVTNGTDLINWVAHGLPADTIVEFKVLPGGTLPGGITADTPYYIVSSGLVANGFKISTTRNGTVLNITADGSGVHVLRTGATFTTVDITANTFTTTGTHGFTAGEPVMFRGTTLPTGVNATTVYTISPNGLTTTVFKVQSGGSDVDLTAAGSGTRYIERITGIMNNNSLTVSGTSSSSNFTLLTVTATINARSFPFDITTGTEPAIFYFDEVYSQALNQATCLTNANCATGTATLGGIASGTSNTFSIAYSSGASGAVSINGAAWATTAPASFTSNGADTIGVRISTPNCNYSPVWADVTINGLTSRLQAYTGGGLTGPTGMTDFISTTNQALNSVIEAPTFQTVNGLQISPSCIRIEGGQYKIGSAGTWTTGTSASGTVANGNAVYVRLTSSGMPNVANVATLYINGVPLNYSVTTGTNISFINLTPATAVTASTVEESLPVTIDFSDALLGPVTFTNGTDRVNMASHGVTAGNPLRFTNAGGALPTGLSATTPYYVINPTASDFQVSTTQGGAAVNFTTDGTGTTNILRLRTATISIPSGATGTSPGIEVYTNGGWSGTWATTKLVGQGDQIKVRLTTGAADTTSAAALLINGQGYTYTVPVP